MVTTDILWSDNFTEEEERVLSRYFTAVGSPVFGVINLPEVVKGALFARYSRSSKSLRRLFLDEFYHEPDLGISHIISSQESRGVGLKRAEELYERIFNQYGDDSVAQLGGAHLACEQASNILTKIIERGRLASYLEQSTRYIVYNERSSGGRFRYRIPAELAKSPLRRTYEATMDMLFDTYSALISNILPWLEEKFPRSFDDSLAIWRATLRAKACDIARGLLPASTLSNIGIFASGQAYEMMLIRMQAHPLQEVRSYAGLMLGELRKLIPSFLKRVDHPSRGKEWSRYLAQIGEKMRCTVAGLAANAEDRPEVDLVDWDSEAETKLVAAALYEFTHLSDRQLLEVAREMNKEEQQQVLSAYFGERTNRRQKPGRALERSFYRFDVLCDYGGFRDLQRHRMLTIEWQKLSTRYGYKTPPQLGSIGECEKLWHKALADAKTVYEEVAREHGEEIAQYVVPFAFRIRFVIHMNAREAFHLLELRSQRGGHPDYRRICHEMHRLIKEKAGHEQIAAAMKFVDYEQYDLERLESERAAERRRQRISLEG